VAEIAGVPKISSDATFVQMNFVLWQYVKITCSVITGSYFLNVHCVHLQTCTEGIWSGIYVNTTEKNMDFPMVNWLKNLSICPKICEKSFVLNAPKLRPMRMLFGSQLIQMRIQAKLVIRYQLSVIGYQLLLLQQNCSTCFYLLLSVLLIIIIILYFLTPVIIITPHYNYSATTYYHDLACYMMQSCGDLTEKIYLGTLSQIIYKPIHYGI